MAELTYTVTVASGNLYGGGTGNVFYLDGARNSTGPGTVNWVNGATLRFDQSDASNDNHPLIFSTTQNTSGIISSGVTYYLDGSSNQTNYTNTTTFNAATTRYIEVTPSSETDFYYLCYVHGIGMGGIFDITQNTWGALSWNTGSWSDQPNVTVITSSFELTPSQGSVDAFPNQGWGSDTWGTENWGESGNLVVLTGLDLSLGFGEQNTWGQNTWGDPFIKWGGTYTPVARIGQQIVETGEQINSTVASVSITTATEIFLSENPLSTLNISEGSVADRTDAFPTGQQLSASVGTAVAQNEQGWGRDDWGVEVWGAEGIWETVSLTGQSLSVDSGVRETWGQDEWGASTTEWGGTFITDVDISIDVEVTSTFTPGWGASVGWGSQSWGQATVDMSMTANEGTVDPAPDTDITGNQANSTTGTISITANADLTLTGQQISVSLGNEDATPNTQVDVTGIQITSTMGVPTAGLSVLVSPTGVTSTFSTGIIGLNAWAVVDPGTAPTWTVVDKADVMEIKLRYLIKD